MKNFFSKIIKNFIKKFINYLKSKFTRFKLFINKISLIDLWEECYYTLLLFKQRGKNYVKKIKKKINDIYFVFYWKYIHRFQREFFRFIYTVSSDYSNIWDFLKKYRNEIIFILLLLFFLVYSLFYLFF